MKKINGFEPTAAMAMDMLVKSMPGKVYNLTAGDPNIEPCDEIKTAYREMDINSTHNYASSQGILELRKQLWTNPDEIIIANGAKQLIFMALTTITKPGDKVVIIGPCWNSYMKMCEILGLEYELICGDAEHRFVPDIEAVRKAVSRDICALIINNPSNPSGVVYEDGYIEELYSMVIESDCWMINDEIYSCIADVKPLSLAGRKNVISINGFSKAFNITGWRLGYAIADAELVKAMMGLQSQMSGPPGTLVQKIISRAIDEGARYETYDTYRRRIDILCRIEKFKAYRPQGGFYFYVPIDDSWKNSIELCEYMLKEHKVAITPGDDYGVERTVRLSVANINEEELEEIVDYLAEI